MANLQQGSDHTMSDSDVKVAVGMWSKDGEYVTMPEVCDCSGQVQYMSCLSLLDTCSICLKLRNRIDCQRTELNRKLMIKI